MADAVIRHRLDLLLRLTDTTSGGVLDTAGVEFFRDRQPFRPLRKEDGNYLFLGIGRENFDLWIRAPGFEEARLRVDFSRLEEKLPRLELHLIPNRHYRGAGPCFTMEGTLPGLVTLDAVRVGDSPCQIKEFDERRRLMTLFNPHRLELSKLYYAVVDPDGQRYEPFVVEAILEGDTLRIDRALTRPFATHFPVARRVFGGVNPDGGYLLRVRDDAREAAWMVRYMVGEEEYFQVVDFRQPGKPLLCPQTTAPAPAVEGV